MPICDEATEEAPKASCAAGRGNPKTLSGGNRLTMTPKERIVSSVFGTAERLGIRLMLVGAGARDFWLARFAVRANVRATQDVDLACLVADWDIFAIQNGISPDLARSLLEALQEG